MNIVIYARYSSHNQTEQSIEGQLKVCRKYAIDNGMTVIREYIDRAQSAKTDNRPAFQQMLHDSEKHTFDAVLVYQLDRFSRNRYDSATNKAKLKKNGVRVISAQENLSDDASGKLIEGVLESMAEYYSNELSEKIKRGLDINGEKCLSTGRIPPVGFKAVDRHFHIDEYYAPIIKEIFERYARGETVKQIITDFNARGIVTPKGNSFNYNAVHRILRNKRYIGVYIYKDKEIVNGMPKIIDDELFYRVQEMLDKSKVLSPGRARSFDEYLLTTKIFCGKCKEMMVGYSGYGKAKRKYNYYKCKGNKTKGCDKKPISKDYIENLVINKCLEILTEENIKYIAKEMIAKCKQNEDSITLKMLKKELSETETAIENLWKAIEKGEAAELFTERINQRTAEKKELEKKIAIEETNAMRLTEPEVYAFLSSLKKNVDTDINKRRAIVNIFIRKIYVYDDYLTLITNGSGNKVSEEDIPLDEIERKFSSFEQCSFVTPTAPPNEKAADEIGGFFVCIIHFSIFIIHYSFLSGDFFK